MTLTHHYNISYPQIWFRPKNPHSLNPDISNIDPTSNTISMGDLEDVDGNSNNNPKNEQYSSYVLVHNIAKRHNVGTLARSCAAFGVAEMILVGRRDFNSFGSHGTTAHLRFRHFHSLSEARSYLKEKNVDICGVEITDSAIVVNDHPFRKSTAFILGNEGTGLSPKECEICDFFVYIPQYGGGTASLNVTVAASIVLHHYGVWAGFSERTRDGHKFVVAEKPAARGKYCTETAESISEERRLKKENGSNGILEWSGKDEAASSMLGTLFAP